MTASVLMHKDITENGLHYHRISLHRQIFTEQSDAVGQKISSIIQALLPLDREVKSTISLDLRKADDILYKPTRLFGICEYFQNEIVESGLSTELVLILREDHIASLSGLEDIDFTILSGEDYENIEVSITKEVTQESPTSEECESPAEIAQLTKAISVSRTILMFCVAGILFSIFVLNGSIGFLVFLVSGVLLFESNYVLRGLKKEISTYRNRRPET